MTRPVYLKAIVGALLALATWGGTALSDENVSSVEWFGLLGAVVTGGLVWLVKNGEDPDPTTSTPEPLPHDAGAVGVLEALLAILVIVVVLVLIGVL